MRKITLLKEISVTFCFFYRIKAHFFAHDSYKKCIDALFSDTQDTLNQCVNFELDNLFSYAGLVRIPNIKAIFKTLHPHLALTLLVSWISFTVDKQTPPPQNKEAVFATPLQGRFSFHPRWRLNAGDMPTRSQQGWSTFKGRAAPGLDGASVHWRQGCTKSCGKAAQASESIGCWWWQRQLWLAHRGQLARKGGSQVSEDEGCHGNKRCKRKNKRDAKLK